MSSIPDLLKTPVKGRHANAESLKQSVEAIEGSPGGPNFGALPNRADRRRVRAPLKENPSASSAKKKDALENYKRRLCQDRIDEAARMTNEMRTSLQASFGKLEVSDLVPSVMCVLANNEDLDSIKNIIQVYGPDAAKRADYDGRTPLHIAAEKGQLQMVKFLVENGADPNFNDSLGTTPLASALVYAQTDVAEYLKSVGATLGEDKTFEGTDLLLAERQRLQCQSVFQQISHNTDKGPRGTVTYDEFTTFLRDQYGLDIEMHEILKHEIHCLVHWTELEMAGKLEEFKNVSSSDGEFMLSPQRRRPPSFEGLLSPRNSHNTVTSCSPRLETHEDTNVPASYDPSSLPTSPVIGLLSPTPRRERANSDATKQLMKKQSSSSRRTSRKPAASNKLISWRAVELLLTDTEAIVSKAFLGNLAVRNWLEFKKQVEQVYKDVEKEVPSTEGSVDAKFKEFVSSSKDTFAVSICTIDGQTMSLGQADEAFPIGSLVKPVLYSLNCEEVGEAYVHEFIGREPAGVSFNSFTLSKEDKPQNACVNSGALIGAAMFFPNLQPSKRFSCFTTQLRQLSGGYRPTFSQTIYLAEKGRADRRHALVNFMRAKGCFPNDGKNYDTAVDFLLQLRSIEVTTKLMAGVGATFANNGLNPFQGTDLLAEANVRNTMQLMYSCGMDNYSGEWACSVGIPAKSASTGAIYFVAPRRCGVCIHAPPTNESGNSVRGQEFCRRFVDKFNWSVLDVLYSSELDNSRI